MRGFFSKIEEVIPYKSEKGIHSCASCGLYKTSSTPRMGTKGDFRKKVLLVTGNIEAEDDRAGKPWNGEVGQLLKRTFRKLGIDVDKDCATIHAVDCYAEKVTEHQVACCRQKLLGVIRRLKPEVIILLGDTALEALIGHKWTRNFGNIEKWRGWTIPDRDYKAWVCPTYSPAFVHGQKTKNEVSVIWEEDLKKALDLIGHKFPYTKDEKDLITVTDDVQGTLIQILEDVPPLLAFDIEATGLKPYEKGHEIVCISFCYNEHKAYCVPFPKTARELVLLKEVLEHPKIGKIAANMSYEDHWLNVLHGIEVSPWKFDTMQAAHILDNRVGITGLKFQGYVRLGQLGYEGSVSTYLTAEDSNSLNRVKELVEDPKLFNELMIYCGIDSLLEFRLAKIQMKELGIE